MDMALKFNANIKLSDMKPIAVKTSSLPDILQATDS